MAEFLTIGEPLVVFAANDVDVPLAQVSSFSRFLAGAELNVAVGVSRLGHSSAYISEVGQDFLGEFIRTEVATQNISNQYLWLSDTYQTGFYFKEAVSQGDPQIQYYRKGSAASHLTKEKLAQLDLSDTKLVHCSGIFPALSPETLTTMNAFMDQLQVEGITTTFDPNLRPSLWNSQAEMVTTLNELAKKAKIILPGISEGEILMGSRDPEDIADFYLGQSDYTEAVIVKLGADGAYVKQRGAVGYVIPGFKVAHVVDTVGAGDGFAVGVITALLEGKDLAEGARRGCAVGALAIQSASDNGGYPTPAELAEFYQVNAE